MSEIVNAAKRIVERHANDTPCCAMCGCREVSHGGDGKCIYDESTCPGFVLQVPDDLQVALFILRMEEARDEQIKVLS